MISQSLVELKQIKLCPSCNSKNINLYGDGLFCFDCKTKIENSDYTSQGSNFNKVLENLKTSMEACGKWCKHKVYCRNCEAEGKEALLVIQKKIHTCDIRLCSKPYCLSQRYAQTMKAFEDVRRLKDLKKLHHFVIGFDKISKEEFENNFDYHKKRFEKVMNVYFKRLRKVGIKLQGFKVLDISKGENVGKWDNKYYIHFHFACIPFKNCDIKKNLTLMQLVRKTIINKQRVKIPFHFQSFKLKEKHSLFSYIALRNIGLYKKYELSKFDNVEEDINFISKIIKEKWITLDKLVTPEQYVHNFFKRRNLSTIGNCYYCFSCKSEMPLRSFSKQEIKEGIICPHCSSKEVKLALPKSLHGSNSRDNMVLVSCSRHGKFNMNDFLELRHEFEICEDPPPDDIYNKDFKKSMLQLVNAIKVEIIKDNIIVKEFKNKKFSIENSSQISQENKDRIEAIINKKVWRTLK